MRATRAEDGAYALIYSATGAPITVNMPLLSGQTVTAWWYDPRTGAATRIGTAPTTGTQTFAPPSSGRGNDWVLALDDDACGFPPPGSAVWP